MPSNFIKNYQSKLERGQLYLIDKIPHGDPDLGGALQSYADSIYNNKQSRAWSRTLHWMENLLFGLGHQYIKDIAMARIGSDTSTTNLINEDLVRNIPCPVNDLLGRYIETNIALLTENRPIPRVTALSDSVKDRKAAELSELTINYLWEELGLPEKHRELARLLMYTGIAFLEVCYDPLYPRYLTAPETETQPTTTLGSGVTVPVAREVPVIDPQTGGFRLKEQVEYGDITANIVSGFEMHLPQTHWWNHEDMGWIMREAYVPIDSLRDKYINSKVRSIVQKSNGYSVDALDQKMPSGMTSAQNFPLWWWERMVDMTEGGGNLYSGSPEQWDNYVLVRYLDRKPNPTWPRGRTIITVGNKVLYDSPKKVGARAFDPKWPKRWNPYVRFRWEAQPGSIYGRSLVGKLLPKLKRVNSIDTTMIMWRRTVPIASWIWPKGTSPVEDFFCIPARSRVVLADGTSKKIKDIQIGDEVFSNGQVATVQAVHNNGLRKDFIVLRVIRNSEFRFTPNHVIPVLRENRLIEVPAKDVKQGDYFQVWSKRARTNAPELDLVELLNVEECRSREGTFIRRWRKNKKGHAAKLPIQGVLSVSDEFLWLLGLYAAEGSTGPTQVIFSLGVHETYLEKRVYSISEKLFGVTPTTEIIMDRGVRNVKLNSTILSALFKTLIPGVARTKYVSKDIFNVSRELAPFVAGWLDGDGTFGIYKGCKSFGGSTSSDSLASQIRLILLDEGYLCSQYRTAHKAWIINLSAGCLDLTSHSVRFVGKEGPKSKIKTDSFKEGDYWYFRVASVAAKTMDEPDLVYDLTTSTGYYNHRGVTIHNSGGMAGSVLEYDPRRTAGAEPKPVFPPSYPAAAMQEREIQLSEMEAIAGTENILRGERPVGVNSSTMLESLRKMALASRSAILQSWDESLQEVGTALLQETIKHIGKDERYKSRLHILAREKASKFAIDEFAGANISDNVQVRIDTASMAMISREAKQQRALELMQYAPGMAGLPPSLRAKLIDELGWPDAMTPQGADIDRARALIQYLKSKRFDLVVPMAEDDPYVIHEMLVDETKGQAFIDLENDVQMGFFKLIDMYKEQIEQIEAARLQFQQQMAMPPQPEPGAK